MHTLKNSDRPNSALDGALTNCPMTEVLSASRVVPVGVFVVSGPSGDRARSCLRISMVGQSAATALKAHTGC